MTDVTRAKIIYALCNDGIAVTQGIVSVNDIFRSIGWAIIKFLANIDDALYGLVLNIQKYLSFGWSDEVQTLVATYKPFLKVLLIISFTFLGVRLLMHKANQQLSVLQNIAICVVICIALPSMTATMGSFTATSVQGIQKAQNTATVTGAYIEAGGSYTPISDINISDVVIASNMVDLKSVDANTGSEGKLVWQKDGKPVGYFKSAQVIGGKWKKININSVMDYDNDDTLVQDDLWQWKMTDPNDYVQGSDNEGIMSDMSEGFFDGFHSYYYRWQIVSWFNMIFELAVIAVVLTFAIIKCFRLIIEVAMAQVYLPFIAASDFATGQRIKEGIKYLLSLFAAIFLCVALLGLFFVGFAWIQSKDFNPVIKFIFEIALAWAIIDGPNILERIIGIDIGVKSGWQMFMGMRSAASVAKGAGAMAAGATIGKRGADGKRHGGIAGAATFAAGTLVGQKNFENAKNAVQGKASDALGKATGGNGVVGAAINTGKAAAAGGEKLGGMAAEVVANQNGLQADGRLKGAGHATPVSPSAVSNRQGADAAGMVGVNQGSSTVDADKYRNQSPFKEQQTTSSPVMPSTVNDNRHTGSTASQVFGNTATDNTPVGMSGGSSNNSGRVAGTDHTSSSSRFEQSNVQQSTPNQSTQTGGSSGRKTFAERNQERVRNTQNRNGRN